MEPDVTIIIPVYKPNLEILNKVDDALAAQQYTGKITIHKINKGGFGKTFNYGVQHSKTEIVISLHQDCVPVNNTWLRDLVAPLKEKDGGCHWLVLFCPCPLCRFWGYWLLYLCH